MASRARDHAYRFVSWPSVTGSPGEAAFSDKLVDYLRALPELADEANTIRTIASHGDPLTHSVAALFRGTGRKCIVLAGHFDVVTVENYGDLRDLAFDADRLAAALVADLKTSARSPRDALALADLERRAFVPGRGMLDMKSGLAAGLAAAERFAADPRRQGNILFVATPDEENRSRGMRSFRNALPALAGEWDLDIVGGLNLDATDDTGDGSAGRSVHFGTVGKYSPFAYTIGKATHAGYPFDGISAHLIGAEILRAVEKNGDLADEAFGAKAPPPVCLEARDFRAIYDVTTPETAWLSFNWLTHRRQPGELLAAFRAEVEAALGRATTIEGSRAAAHEGMRRDHGEPRVFTVEEAVRLAESRGGAAFRERHAQRIAALAREENPLTASQSLVRALAIESGIEGPAVIIGFASLFYPHTHVDASSRFRAIVAARSAGSAARHGTTISTQEFFRGISDMSFFGHRADSDAARLIAANTLSPALVDEASPDALSFPVANIGPWGRDLHQKHERVAAHHAFEVLPDMLFDVSSVLLADEG
jgi:arginine utilization protein RocB